MRFCLSYLISVVFVCTTMQLQAETIIRTKKHKTSIPFELYNNIMVVKMDINRSKTLHFIFDSGCRSNIVLHPKWLDSFQIVSDEKVFFSGLGLKDTIETIKATNCQIQLAALTDDKADIYFLNKDTLLLENYLGTPIDGIFGAELFKKYYIHINYKKRLIELFENKPSGKIKSDFKKIPLKIKMSKGYYTCIIMNANGELYESELLLDTGANLPLLIKNTSPEQMGVLQYKEIEIGEGLAGPLLSKVGRTKTLFFDTLRFEQPVTCFSETPLSLHENNDAVLNGNIGNDILSRLDIYFAYPEQSLYYRTTKHTYEPFYFNISNIILLQNKSGNGGFIVKNIIPNSPPSEMGLDKGDEILEINGVKTEKMEMSDALYLLNRKIGKKITVVFRHLNQTKKITYKLESVI
ncbi:MAG TPA: PDZ domain-containing protein [Chitinophagales bacterium]|nr:PDZ domain-containing protein [Chitinophagales bacterium]